jgi:hypothetical protein
MAEILGITEQTFRRLARGDKKHSPLFMPVMNDGRTALYDEELSRLQYEQHCIWIGTPRGVPDSREYMTAYRDGVLSAKIDMREQLIADGFDPDRAEYPEFSKEAADAYEAAEESKFKQLLYSLAPDAEDVE